MSKPAPDLSEFEALGGPFRRNMGCWFTRLTEEQQAKVVAAQAAGYNYKQINTVMVKWGVEIGTKTIGDHFRGDCSCGK